MVTTDQIHCVLLFLLLPVFGIEHDSLFDCNNGALCPEPSHTIIRLNKRDDQLAAQIAADHGLRIRGRPFLDSHYFVEHIDQTKSVRRKRQVIAKLEDTIGIESVFEQRPRTRTKRDFIQPPSNLPSPQLPWSDPLYRDQWYLTGGASGGFDMNVREAWLLGYSGRNVSVSILDDGIQKDHLDLYLNYDPLSSTDINDHDDDPTPQNNGDNKHGTRCAGEVAAIAGNDQCGVGVAYHARIGGVRMLDGPVSDSVEAASLSLNQQHIDIYSASWGPEDDGKTFDGPGPLAREAFYRGIKEGRGGKGNIFVWASGNGGSRQDSCSADGYTTSVYTLSISSATFDNHRPWYLEECPSSIATTYSSANMNQPAIVTVDVPNGCTKMHTGTSASAPLAAGIIALALEANPNLTWRDMQHLVLRTANPIPLLNNPGWSTNGVGRRISNKFGYGLMDAGALVKMARIWQNVGEQHICTYEYQLAEPNPRPLTGRFQLNFSLSVNGCERGTPVLYLEHVQVLTTIRFGKRGDLKLTLFSPIGTRSVLLPPRPQDFNTNGFHKWPFLSVQMWGEDPRGTWTLMVESVTTNRNLAGTFHDWSLLLYGTDSPAQDGDQVHNGIASGRTVVTERGNVGSDPSSMIQEPTMSATDDAGGNGRTTVGNCHAECAGGCSQPQSATECFECRHLSQSLRNRAGKKCVEHCDEGFYIDRSTTTAMCRLCSPKCRTCTEAEMCATCAGAQLLIDVDHYGHFDHGQCVDKCPDGLVADYDNAIQARCLLPTNPCGVGYFQLDVRAGATGNCQPCNHACHSCHGPSTIDCDSCASGYSNRTARYCRPCCVGTQEPELDHCEDCTKSLSHSFRNWVILSCFCAVLLFFCFFALLMLKDRHYDRTDVNYSRLPIRYEIGSKTGLVKGHLLKAPTNPTTTTSTNITSITSSDDSDDDYDVFDKSKAIG